MTKIVFMGTPAFSVPILESLIEAGYDVQAVVTRSTSWPKKSDYPNACQRSSFKT